MSSNILCAEFGLQTWSVVLFLVFTQVPLCDSGIVCAEEHLVVLLDLTMANYKV